MAKHQISDDVKNDILHRYEQGETPESIAESLGFDGKENRPHPFVVWGIIRGGANLKTVTETKTSRYVEGAGQTAPAGPSFAAPLFQSTNQNPIEHVEVYRRVANPAEAGVGYLGDEEADVTQALILERFGGGVYRLEAYDHHGRRIRVRTIRSPYESKPVNPDQVAFGPMGGEDTREIAELRKMVFEMAQKTAQDAKEDYARRAEADQKRWDHERALERDRQQSEREAQREWLAMLKSQEQQFMLQMEQLRRSGEKDEGGGGADELIDTFLKLDKIRGGGPKDPLTALIDSGAIKDVKEMVQAGSFKRTAQSLPATQPAQAALTHAQAAQAPAQNLTPEQAQAQEIQQIGERLFSSFVAQGIPEDKAEALVWDILTSAGDKVGKVKAELEQQAQAHAAQAAPANGAAQTQKPAAPAQPAPTQAAQ